MKKSATFSIILIIAALGFAAFYFLGTPAPAVSLTPDGGPLSAQKELSLKLAASRGLLKELTVSAVQGEKTVEVLTKEYPAGTHDALESFNLSQAALKDGALKLQITASSSPARFGAGRTTTLSRSFDYESAPPAIGLLSAAHNITRGGAGLVVYTISKEVEKTGVTFSDRSYPGYKQSGNFYACLFPFPYDIDQNRYVPKVTAVDRAGNDRVATINYHLLPKSFPADKITLSDGFLDKVAAEFRNRFPKAATPLEIFLKANSELRQQDAKTLLEYGRKTSPVPLWQGAFLRLPNSAPRGAFAQARTYIYNGQVVDHQTHLGVDLASLAHSPVPAANNGKVIFAGDLGLYGQCIVIDHGLGLQSLYGHLSQISVKVGDTVEKGTLIGNTGSTGMAGGDHLHFSMLVSGEQVNPLEWWDPSWIKNNVTSKLDIGKTLVPPKQEPAKEVGK